MIIEAVFFDLGGVILRTEYQAPREHLAERLGLSYEDLVGLVFEGESAKQASLGRITALQHWEAVARRLGRSPDEIPALRAEFFGGDVLDRSLLEFIRSLRPVRKTGIISNAWLDLREYIHANGFQDAFDSITISAEVGLLKPGADIYRVALEAIGTNAERAVMIDDLQANVEAARALGMHGVLFRDEAAMLSELRRLLA